MTPTWPKGEVKGGMRKIWQHLVVSSVNTGIGTRGFPAMISRAQLITRHLSCVVPAQLCSLNSRAYFRVN